MSGGGGHAARPGLQRTLTKVGGSTSMLGTGMGGLLAYSENNLGDFSFSFLPLMVENAV